MYMLQATFLANAVYSVLNSWRAPRFLSLFTFQRALIPSCSLAVDLAGPSCFLLTLLPIFSSLALVRLTSVAQLALRGGCSHPVDLYTPEINQLSFDRSTPRFFLEIRVRRAISVRPQ